MQVGRDVEELYEAAKKAIVNSYAPYSKFRVSAAVRGGSGKIYTGVNVENASYGLTVCAERVAIFKAVSEGERFVKDVLVYTESELDKPVAPCGACRQVIAEFNPNARVIIADKKGIKGVYSLKELLPLAFTPDYLIK